MSILQVSSWPAPITDTWEATFGHQGLGGPPGLCSTALRAFAEPRYLHLFLPSDLFEEYLAQ